MDLLITLIRFPVGCFASIVTVAFLVAIFPLELAFVLLALPFLAIFDSRENARNLASGFPNSLRMIPDALTNIWQWVGVI